MRRLSVLFALLGVSFAVWLVLRFDAGDVLGAVLSVGWQGALALGAWQALLFTLLGLAWHAVQPGLPARRLIWGRMVRDAATACLPFSPVGGYVIGARAIALRGTEWPVAAAGTVVDVSAELAAQLVFTLFGALALWSVQPSSNLLAPVSAGAVAVLALAGLAWRSRRRIGRLLDALAGRLLGTQGRLERLQREMAQLYASPARLATGSALHLLAWAGTGGATWISLRLLGQATALIDVLALEALLDAAVAVAFVVPAAAGVQEAGYIGLGSLFGVPPDLALGVSLLRRAREIGWGVPVLSLWQWQEVRRLKWT